MESEAVALICTSETIPVNEIVGVADILSEKVAVMVTTSELDTILSESVSVRVTVGTVVSNKYPNPSKSVIPPEVDFPIKDCAIVSNSVEDFVLELRGFENTSD